MKGSDHEEMALDAWIVERWEIFETVHPDDMPLVRENVRGSFEFRMLMMRSSWALMRAQLSIDTMRSVARLRQLRERPRDRVAILGQLDEGTGDVELSGDAAGDVVHTEVGGADDDVVGSYDGDDDSLSHDDDGSSS